MLLFELNAEIKFWLSVQYAFSRKLSLLLIYLSSVCHLFIICMKSDLQIKLIKTQDFETWYDCYWLNVFSLTTKRLIDMNCSSMTKKRWYSRRVRTWEMRISKWRVRVSKLKMRVSKWEMRVLIIYKKQKFKIIKRLRFEFRQAIRSSKFERFRKKSISTILQFDQRYTQQIDTFSRNLSNSYNWVNKTCLRREF